MDHSGSFRIVNAPAVGRTSFSSLRLSVPAPTGRNPHDRVLLPTLARHERRGPGSGSSNRSRPPGLNGGAALTLAQRSVIGAGFALPRDAGRRPALRCRARFTRVSRTRSRPPPAGRADRRSTFPDLRVVKEKSDPPSRCASRSGADQRSGFPSRGHSPGRKTVASNPEGLTPACPGGKCERGARPPFTISNDQSELAAARRRRARKFRLPARSAGRTPDGAPN